ncbi:MAG: hypothetical protein SCK28_07185 [Bacillota bacterium]|nr:hypothetical protein [Bacillota bacterium]
MKLKYHARHTILVVILMLAFTVSVFAADNLSYDQEEYLDVVSLFWSTD